MSVIPDNAEPLAIVFDDDGLVPNNALPFLVYQGAVRLDPKHPEETIEHLFGANGWGGHANQTARSRRSCNRRRRTGRAEVKIGPGCRGRYSRPAGADQNAHPFARRHELC